MDRGHKKRVFTGKKDREETFISLRKVIKKDVLEKKRLVQNYNKIEDEYSATNELLKEYIYNNANVKQGLERLSMQVKRMIKTQDYNALTTVNEVSNFFMTHHLPLINQMIDFISPGNDLEMLNTIFDILYMLKRHSLKFIVFLLDKKIIEKLCVEFWVGSLKLLKSFAETQELKSQIIRLFPFEKLTMDPICYKFIYKLYTKIIKLDELKKVVPFISKSLNDNKEPPQLLFSLINQFTRDDHVGNFVYQMRPDIFTKMITFSESPNQRLVCYSVESLSKFLTLQEDICRYMMTHGIFKVFNNVLKCKEDEYYDEICRFVLHGVANTFLNSQEMVEVFVQNNLDLLDTIYKMIKTNKNVGIVAYFANFVNSLIVRGYSQTVIFLNERYDLLMLTMEILEKFEHQLNVSYLIKYFNYVEYCVEKQLSINSLYQSSKELIERYKYHDYTELALVTGNIIDLLEIYESAT